MPRQNRSRVGKNWFDKYRKNWDLLLLFLPGFLLLLIFKYVPMYGVIIAFKDFKMMDGILASPWVGFEHFQRLFASSDFLNAFWNSLYISVLKLITGFPASIILALLINEIKAVRFKKIVQSCTYVTYFFSWVVLSGIITMLFSVNGPVNELLAFFGVKKPLEFFADGGLFIFMLVITAIWQSCGWNSILFLATISGIDDSLYEAARIDGANRLQQARWITLPALIPTIVTVFILNLGTVLNAGFDQIYNLYNPVVFHVSDILDTYVLRRMQALDLSLGTAAGLFKSVICFALIAVSNHIVKRVTDNEMGIWYNDYISPDI